LGLLVTGPACAANARATTAPAPNKLTVAVLDFESASPTVPDQGSQIAEALTANLSSDLNITLVDRSSLDHTLTENSLSLTGLVNPDDAIRIGHLVGAKLLITGKLFTLNKTLFLTAKIIGSETTLVEVVSISDSENADTAAMVAKLAKRISQQIRDDGQRLVAPPGVADPIPGLKAKLAGQKLPTITLNVSETHEGATHPVDPAAETEMRIVLQQVGFECADNVDPPAPAKNGQVHITGAAASEFAARIGDLVTCSARLEITMTQPNNPAILLSDRITTRAADLSENVAAKTALQKAGHELAIHVAQYFVDHPSTQPTIAP
jgi:TolB-like protein